MDSGTFKRKVFNLYLDDGIVLVQFSMEYPGVIAHEGCVVQRLGKEGQVRLGGLHLSLETTPVTTTDNYLGASVHLKSDDIYVDVKIPWDAIVLLSKYQQAKPVTVWDLPQMPGAPKLRLVD